MTVFEALKGLGAEYSVSDTVIEIVLIGRDIDGTKDFMELDSRMRFLLRLDLLLNIILFSPSSTSSQSVSHGGFQKAVGSRTDTWINRKLDWIFKMYGLLEDDLYPDPRGLITFMSNPII